MRLSTLTYEIINMYGEEEALKIIKDAGFDGIDYTFCEKKDMLKGDYIAKANTTKSLLQKYDLKCLQAHAPFDWPYEKMDEFYPYTLRAIEYAGIIGAKYIVVHGVVPENEKDIFEYNLNFYKNLEPYAKKAGVLIGVENLIRPDTKRKCWKAGDLGDPAWLCNLVDALNSDTFVICVDVGHAALSHHEPEDFIRKIGGEKLKMLHIHDTDYLNDTHTLPGLGKLNWENIMSALSDVGYSGDFSTELTGYYKGFGKDTLADAIVLAEKVLRNLIKNKTLK